jgi:hypothetical protein
MRDDEIVSVGEPLPQIAWAVPLGGRKVKLIWTDGGTKVVDLTAVFASRRIFMPLRNDDGLFKTLRVSEYGSALEWDGPDLEVSASWLARLPEAEFTNEEFREAMERLRMTNEGMAAELEISRSQVAQYKKDKPIPRHIAHATRYLLRRAEAA